MLRISWVHSCSPLPLLVGSSHSLGATINAGQELRPGGPGRATKKKKKQPKQRKKGEPNNPKQNKRTRPKWQILSHCGRFFMARRRRHIRRALIADIAEKFAPKLPKNESKVRINQRIFAHLIPKNKRTERFREPVIFRQGMAKPGRAGQDRERIKRRQSKLSA